MPYLLNAVRGFLMGSADVVPGVSGGTVALVLGIYERLVVSIRMASAAVGTLLRGRLDEARSRLTTVEWRLVLPLVGGIVIAIFSLASVISGFLETQPTNTAAAFFGLVAGSVVFAWRLLRRWDRPRLAAAAGMAVGAFLLLGLRGEAVADPAPAFFFGAGAVAVVAMILPGISGSFILLIVGMYHAVLDAVEAPSYGRLALFVFGAGLGLALSATLLDRMLRLHHDTVMAGLIGLMIGSLRVLWPWPDGTDTTTLGAPSDPVVPLLLALAGFAAVAAVGRLAKR